MKLAGHVAHLGEKRNACRVLVGRHEEKRLLGRLGLDLKETGWESMGWIYLTQDWGQFAGYWEQNSETYEII